MTLSVFHRDAPWIRKISDDDFIGTLPADDTPAASRDVICGKLSYTGQDGDTTHYKVVASGCVWVYFTDGSGNITSSEQYPCTPGNTLDIIGPHAFGCNCTRSKEPDREAALALTPGQIDCIYVIFYIGPDNPYDDKEKQDWVTVSIVGPGGTLWSVTAHGSGDDSTHWIKGSYHQARVLVEIDPANISQYTCVVTSGPEGGSDFGSWAASTGAFASVFNSPHQPTLFKNIFIRFPDDNNSPPPQGMVMSIGPDWPG